jgi:hypothetical protein
LFRRFVDNLLFVIGQDFDDRNAHRALIKKFHHRTKFAAGGVPQIIIGLKDEIPDNAHGTWQASWSLVVLSEAPRHCGLWCYAFAMAGVQAWMTKRLETSPRQGLA